MERCSPVPFNEKSLALKLTDLTVQTPDGKKQLTHQLNLTLQSGKSVLIMGASGTGKKFPSSNHCRLVAERRRERGASTA